VFEVVNAAQVNAHLEIVRLKRLDEFEVLLPGRVAAQIRAVSLTGKDAWGGRG
jgi:hypothetical protein